MLALVGSRSTAEDLPMTPAQCYDEDAERLLAQIKALTDASDGLNSDLHWLAVNAQGAALRQFPLTEQNVQTVAALKSAIDNMRALLWDYIETVAEVGF